ncbi:hypothetical protein KYI11_00275 [Macrococcoides bohemicum]|uniref:Uncharacterized protein n=1 Tax=Macrococcoides bohemicum TaxID=1903056 RepID=A0AAE7Q360_9STAP|nr:hypothetical protein [Macrococcus bohemicus]QRN48633.1 hypothetical protein HT586_00275 [Macrococcus bohemicus]QYA42430.1 hypothetical protein KYI11_00275 [Macrococcus bohemicus]
MRNYLWKDDKFTVVTGLSKVEFGESTEIVEINFTAKREMSVKAYDLVKDMIDYVDKLPRDTHFFLDDVLCATCVEAYAEAYDEYVSEILDAFYLYMMANLNCEFVSNPSELVEADLFYKY